MSDIETVYEHSYKTRFIIDESSDFSRLKEMNLEKYERLFVVADEKVYDIYGDRIENILNSWDKKTNVFTVEAIEYTKSIGFYPKLVEFLESNTAGRYDAVIAIGGGIVIDLVSFTVSTYMRGLPLFIIASTLIGQTDASTAGKTCLNSGNAKNLLGTFYYPEIVYNSIEIMKTCSPRITRQGLSEAFKYSLLTDGDLLDTIIEYQNSEYNNSVMKKIVEKTIEARIAIRKVDPLASNLGHTFGHALEKYFDYKILHGDAILIGTVMAINYATKKDLMTKDEKDKIFGLMRQAHLNTYILSELDVKRLVDYMRKDKKSSASKLHLVMINGIGKPYRADTPFFEAEYADVEEFLSEFMSQYKYKKDNYIEYLNGDKL